MLIILSILVRVQHHLVISVILQSASILPSPICFEAGIAPNLQNHFIHFCNYVYIGIEDNSLSLEAKLLRFDETGLIVQPYHHQRLDTANTDNFDTMIDVECLQHHIYFPTEDSIQQI